MGKWSDLPVELVELIEDNVEVYADKVRLRAVCLFWHCQLPKIKHDLPWLLQAVDDNVEASHAFFNPIDKKYYYLDVPNVLQGKIFKGSSHGWVVTVEDTMCNTNKFKKDCNRIYLINPLTSACIELPSRDKFPDIMKYNPYRVDKEYSVLPTFNTGKGVLFYPTSSQEVTDIYTNKFVMSCDPSRSHGKECVIATIYGRSRKVACCTRENKRWNALFGDDVDDREEGGYLDIIFHKGKLHALLQYVGIERKLLAFENINRDIPNPRMTVLLKYTRNPVIERNSPTSITVIEDYMVERSDGSCLMLVERAVKGSYKEIEGTTLEVYQTLYFKVYEVDAINSCLVELKSIGEDAIILGLNTPVAISSRNAVGYKGNHIYYTDVEQNHNRVHCKLENNEIGVFSLEDGTIQPLCGLKSSSKVIWPPPIWVSPRDSRRILKKC